MPFLLVLGLATFASAFSLRAVDPMLNILAADLKVTLQEVALLASAFTLPYAATQILFGPIGDAVGKVRLIRINLLMLAAGLAISALATSHPMLLAARVFSGAFAGGIIPVVLALVGDKVSFEARPLALSHVVLASVTGQLVGSAASGFIAASWGWRAVFWTACTLAVATAATCLFSLREDKVAEPLSFTTALRRYGTVLRNPLSGRLYLVVAIEGAFSFGAFPMVAPLMVAHGLGDAMEAGLVLAAFAIGGAGYTFAVPALVPRLGLGGMMGVGAASLGLLFIIAALVPSLALVAIAFAMGGFCFYMLHNVLQILATELAPQARGSAVALFASAFFIGQALGAVATAQAAVWLSAEGVFLLAGVVLIALAYPASRLAPAEPPASG